MRKKDARPLQENRQTGRGLFRPRIEYRYTENCKEESRE